MIQAPQLFLDALRHSHEAELKVEAFDPSGARIGVLPVTRVTVTSDGTADVRRTVDVETAIDFVDSEDRDALEAVDTSGTVLRISYGVARLPVIPIATVRVDEIVGQLTSPARTLRCFDRAILPQEHLLETGQPLDDTYVNLIERLLQQTIPGEALNVEAGIDTTKRPADGKALSRGDNRLHRMQELAEAAGGWVFNDEFGNFVLAPFTPFGGNTVWQINAGHDGVLVDAAETFSRREQYNAVGLEFRPNVSGEDWSKLIFLWDNDPNSVTYYDGPFGKRPIFLQKQYDFLPSDAEAEELARRKLSEYTGRTRTLDLAALYNPLLTPGDKIEVVFPDGDVESHIIDALSLSLGDSVEMQVATRVERPVTITRSRIL